MHLYAHSLCTNGGYDKLVGRIKGTSINLHLQLNDIISKLCAAQIMSQGLPNGRTVSPLLFCAAGSGQRHRTTGEKTNQEGDVFLADEKQKCAEQECILVPNTGRYSYILEHTVLRRCQGRDKGPTQCNRKSARVIFLLIIKTVFTLKLKPTGTAWASYLILHHSKCVTCMQEIKYTA